MPQQTIHRGIRQMVMAPWLATGSYGTAHRIRGARNMGVDIVVETDEQRGDDSVLDRYTKIVSVTVNIEVATVDLQWLDMVMGGTLVYNASYYDFEVGSDDETPYVGIAGRVVGSGGSADLHIQIHKAKLSSNLQMQAAVDSYLVPQASFQGVEDGTKFYRYRNFTALTNLELPLRTATGGFS